MKSKRTERPTKKPTQESIKIAMNSEEGRRIKAGKASTLDVMVVVMYAELIEDGY